VYMRVSTSQQTTRSQEPDLKRWVLAQILQQGRI
jgi:DNA invertase Pin-like site-specific DNA recombinase